MQQPAYHYFSYEAQGKLKASDLASNGTRTLDAKEIS